MCRSLWEKHHNQSQSPESLERPFSVSRWVFWKSAIRIYVAWPLTLPLTPFRTRSPGEHVCAAVSRKSTTISHKAPKAWKGPSLVSSRFSGSQPSGYMLPGHRPLKSFLRSSGEHVCAAVSGKSTTISHKAPKAWKGPSLSAVGSLGVSHQDICCPATEVALPLKSLLRSSGEHVCAAVSGKSTTISHKAPKA